MVVFHSRLFRVTGIVANKFVANKFVANKFVANKFAWSMYHAVL